MPNKYQHLLELVKTGYKPTIEEIRSIRSQLASQHFESDPYTLLHIVGTCNDVGSLSVVRQYLDFSSGDEENDAMVRRLSLQIVGRMWALSDSFEIAITKALQDSSKYVRAAAATIIGFLGNRYPQLRKRAAEVLLSGIERHDTDDYTRESFYYGLLELLDIPVTEWPPVNIPLTDKMLRPEVLSRARSILHDAPL